MQGYFEPLQGLPAYRELREQVQAGNTPVLLTGVVDVQKVHMLCGLLEELERPGLLLTHSQRRAAEMAGDAAFFRGEALVFPVRDFLAYRADAHSMEEDTGRMLALDALAGGKQTLVVASVEALFDRLLPPAAFRSFRMEWRPGDVLHLDETAERLVTMGYERVERAEAPGQFALRGGILDVFSPGEERVQRVELWDDEVDSVRLVDPLTQRSVGQRQVCRVLPVSELCCDPGEKAGILARWDKAIVRQAAKGEDTGRLQAMRDEFADGTLRELSLIYPFLPGGTATLLEYLPQNTVVFFDDPTAIRVHADQVEAMFAESVKDRLKDGRLLPEQSGFLYGYDEILAQTKSLDRVLLSAFAQKAEGFRLKSLISLAAVGMPSFRQRMDLFAEELAFRKKERASTLVLGGSEGRCQRLVKTLNELGIEGAFVSNPQTVHLKPGVPVVAPGSISKGFGYPDIRFGVFSEQELFGEKSGVRRPRKKKKKGAAIASFTDLKPGDYVVHDNHGVGVFRGLETITSDGISKEYMKISYAAGGNLFIPVSQLDMLQRYIGGEGSAPKLNKLGGEGWNRSKARARAAVAELAKGLVELYAKRQKTKGFVYGPDTLWQQEFEADFPFEETDDQLAAIADVKRDMEAGRVMDRLICGDVGYGKTEVALRAAFKAVQDGKQVAMLAPTTILVQQHFRTMQQRMGHYPVTIRQLSRFVGAKEQKETLKGLANGQVDIVVGTHRLFSKDIQFKDLGLLIIDEEQRFGVAHKERLKQLKESVDVLTLSATPIPRTLHMSLSGVRDMSLLEEPPQERRPVQTYVLENNQEFIREAIYRELDRQGQVYYLHNRVGSLPEEAARVQALVPEARVGYAHGQMSEAELEAVMQAFLDGELDVLVCTTIIESGLDIPNVNTLIVQDADHLGLSQLYQLRGRVGRSNRTAYAYLFYRYNKVLSEEASARLQAIREFTAFGSGFKIAMRDLEIRGAGNFLGAEQHGHMEAVGYDLYCRLLDEEVRRLQGETVEEDFETTIDLSINAYLPDFYIPNEEQRLEMYQKISAIRDTEDFFDVQDELLDRFGEMPRAAGMLLETALLKARAHRLGMESITQKTGTVLFAFRPNAGVEPARLTALLARDKSRYLFSAGASPYLTVKLKKGEDPFSSAQSVVEALTPEEEWGLSEDRKM